ncbi:hypothetical protein HJC23_012812 [Cyclotella cryptica]|uniref:Major facilitator superfamily (MFS) profile domain-containing protein n=1 Tax=Cyclotella cryptica TaxID=29204 RepID=A0ABD3P091_9STRA
MFPENNASRVDYTAMTTHSTKRDVQEQIQHAAPFHISIIENGPLEATGLSLIAFGRGAVGMSTLFLGPALLKLANDAVQMTCDNDENDADLNCNGDDQGRVYGMKPSSLLTIIGVVSGLLSTLMLPLFGAIVDHTPHRKKIGQISIAVVTIIKGIEIFVSPATWFAVSIFQVVNFILYNAHSCAIYAYTAEVFYNAKFQEINYISMLVFLIIVMVLSFSFATDEVGTACISQSLAFLVCSCAFGLAWKWFMSPRPALRHVLSDSTLLKSGFQKLFNTFRSLWCRWYALRYFLLSVMLSESATAALSTISTTYMTLVLEMNSNQIGLAFLCVFVAGIPGSKLGYYVGNALNPLTSAKLCLVVFIINTALAAILLKGPDHINSMYIFASIWGVCIGWLHPTHSALYITIIPRGSESEMMGLYLFSGSVLSFLPPFVFTLLNEIGMRMDMGLASLNLFFAGGFAFLSIIGNYNDAVDFALVSQFDEELPQILGIPEEM